DEWNSSKFREWLTKNSTVGKHVVVLTFDAIKVFSCSGLSLSLLEMERNQMSNKN
ncbi:hypothetical protein Tco_1280144, partial [Tanacetum coccineum]